MIRKGFCVGAISIAFLLFTWTTAMGAQELHMGTSPVGGVGYSAGVCMAQLLNKYLPEFHITAEITAGALENLRLMGEKKMEIAITSPYHTAEAIKGLPPFKEKIPLRTIIRAVPLTNEFITLESSGIKTHGDLRGKRVNIGHAGGADIHGLALLDAYGLTRKDVKASLISVGASVEALKDGKLDAVTSTPQLMNQAMATHKVHVLWPDEAHIEIIMKRNPTFGKWLMPAGFVKGVTKDMWVPDFGFQFTCREEMDPQAVYKITKVLVEHLDELAGMFSQFVVSKEWAASSLGIPFHAGAMKYFQEAGIKQ